MAKCKGITKKGEPCPVSAMVGEEYCFFHHPDKAQERLAAGRKGTAARNRQSTRQSLEHVIGELVDVEDGKPLDIEDLEGTRRYVLERMDEIHAKTDGTTSVRESRELRGWTMILLKIQELGGLGAMSRIYELEALVSQLDGAERKLLPAPEEE